jgi:CRISPR/Cas system-associated exonuclease Cas4 (RecB family)
VPEPPTFDLIGDFEIRPELPQFWSFSALRDFEDCPKRWALSRVDIDCFGGVIPQKPTRRSVEGILFHELLERHDQYLSERGDDRFRPRKTLLALLEEWRRKNESNPRINSEALAGQVAIEEILRAFAQAVRHMRLPERKTLAKGTFENNRAVLRNHAEVWLRDPESKLCGRADHIESAEIIDFKTGEEHPYYVDQVLFYAALYLACTGNAPKALRIIYAATDTTIEVPVPQALALKESLADMRRHVSVAEKRISESDLPAKPEPLKCAKCHVRALCDQYWATRHSFVEPEIVNESRIMDYAPSAAARIEAAAYGLYVRDVVDRSPSCFYVPGDILPDSVGASDRVRMLSVRATFESKIIRFAFTQSSEVYVLRYQARKEG